MMVENEKSIISMITGLFKPKCEFCGKKDGFVKFQTIHRKRYYHQQCLDDIVNKPEGFDTKAISKAWEITDVISEKALCRKDYIYKIKANKNLL